MQLGVSTWEAAGFLGMSEKTLRVVYDHRIRCPVHTTSLIFGVAKFPQSSNNYADQFSDTSGESHPGRPPGQICPAHRHFNLAKQHHDLLCAEPLLRHNKGSFPSSFSHIAWSKKARSGQSSLSSRRKAVSFGIAPQIVSPQHTINSELRSRPRTFAALINFFLSRLAAFNDTSFGEQDRFKLGAPIRLACGGLETQDSCQSA